MHQDYFPPLYENHYYHIYNRGNNGENLFYSDENYNYFLRKYDEYMSNYLETYCYCLLPNHFHFLVKVKNFAELPKEVSQITHGNNIYTIPEKIISEQFRRFFLSYSKSIKLQENRTGSLFEKNFKRKLVSSPKYFTNLVSYIHKNPELHGISKDFKTYPHSSYLRIIHPRISKLMKEVVLNWFGGQENYINAQHEKVNIEEIKKILIEDNWLVK